MGGSQSKTPTQKHTINPKYIPRPVKTSSSLKNVIPAPFKAPADNDEEEKIPNYYENRDKTKQHTGDLEYRERMDKLKAEQRKKVKEMRQRNVKKRGIIEHPCEREDGGMGARSNRNGRVPMGQRFGEVGLDEEEPYNPVSHRVSRRVEKPKREAYMRQNLSENVPAEEEKKVPEINWEEEKETSQERRRRAEAAQERKEKMKKVLELKEKAKEMYSKRNIDERTGNQGFIGMFRRQLRQRQPARSPKKEAIYEIEEVKESETVYKDKIDFENATEAEIIDDYKEQMIAIRNFILFDEKIPDNKVNSKDLIEKQQFIRNQLGLNKVEENEQSLDTGFKIIDTLNMQTLFVHDPEFECYSVMTGKKFPTGSNEKGVFCYFKSEGRECVHCAEEFAKGDILMKLSSCGHVFHADCAEEYMYYSNQCPLCRAVLYQKNTHSPIP
ncbi:unnamed protein product [Moneuplotes crassus]|uniref:RING-type domain-containing protein n=1 Tax=Euplotes crassus TaxID=5936 RepID=A0AAD1UH18_EUPCR|nr:unnamed protein product [Moneuplotes crassus]